jgi:metal-sulfur cluster biosynthetic enzyme
LNKSNALFEVRELAMDDNTLALDGTPKVQAEDCCSHSAEAIRAATCDSDAPASSASDDAVLLDALRTVIDPELFVNIVDLGLVYNVVRVDDKVNVEMTLTSPACPAGPQLVTQSKKALEGVEGVAEATIKLVLNPPWTPDRMTDQARDQLGIF